MRSRFRSAVFKQRQEQPTSTIRRWSTSARALPTSHPRSPRASPKATRHRPFGWPFGASCFSMVLRSASKCTWWIGNLRRRETPVTTPCQRRLPSICVRERARPERSSTRTERKETTCPWGKAGNCRVRRGLPGLPSRALLDHGEPDLDVAPRRVGVRAHLVRRLHQRLRRGPVEFGRVHDEVGFEAEAPVVEGPDADAG
jgi:hypothetical protein